MEEREKRIAPQNIRFRDPVGSKTLDAMEADLSASMGDLEQALLDNDCEAALSLGKKGEMFLAERNRLCKSENTLNIEEMLI